jgi:hypothetical protein
LQYKQQEGAGVSLRQRKIGFEDSCAIAQAWQWAESRSGQTIAHLGEIREGFCGYGARQSLCSKALP